ncbi:MAG: hypothetical protein MRZ79_19410 [Bacteroidia bacterium]|nr:hypothetical protein [Bacteroidia bacterium]
MYADIFKEKFPQDEKNGLFKFPQLPAVRLGRLLARDTRISSPNDVVALHMYSGTFSGSNTIIFTTDKCFYPSGSFELEDIQKVDQSKSKLTVITNQQNQFVSHPLSTKNEQVAKTIKRILESLKRKDPVAEKLVKKTYENYSHTELDWLNLRDEIMATIDMLFERYNDGKLTLLEYESKKEELMSRL